MQVANTAHSDFLRVRRKAFWRGIAKWLLRSDDALLAFDDVRKQLHAHLQHDGGMREVPIDQIVGSVGRYRDFDRAFLPRQARTRGRWESIDTAYLTHVELPPIELYKIGETYFVKDGNHRVSVARERGQSFIDAHVIEVTAPAPVHSLEDLLEHISTHRWYLGIEAKGEIPYSEAVASWYERIYLPTVEAIRATGALRDFRHRPEADLHLWITEDHWYLHQEALPKGSDLKELVSEYAEEHSERHPNPLDAIARIGPLTAVRRRASPRREKSQ